MDGTVLRLLARLGGRDATLERSLGVAVQLVRNLALEPLGKGALGAVIPLVLSSLNTGRNSKLVVRAFLRGTDAALRLLPRELEIVNTQVAIFLRIRGISSGPELS